MAVAADGSPESGPFRGVTPEERARIEAAVPSEAPARPAQARRLMVFDRNVNYGGHRSIPHANLAFVRMGEKTGAFEAVVETEPAAQFVLGDLPGSTVPSGRR